MPTTELSITDPDQTVSSALDKAIAQVVTPDASFSADINHLAARTRELADALVARGDACLLGVDEDTNDLDCRLTHFVWADRAKHFLVLYRNVQLQLQTAALMVADGQCPPKLVTDLHARSSETLQAAEGEWEEEMANWRKRLEGNPKKRQEALDRWQQQHNPWPEYRQQLLQVGQQGESLAVEHTVLHQQVGILSEIREILKACATEAQTALSAAMYRADEITAFVTESASDEADHRPGKIATRLDEYLNDAIPGRLIHEFTNELTEKIGELAERVRVTVGADHGMLQFKDVNFRRATDQWISAEILPQLYELWELSDQTKSDLGVAIANVRNRTLLLSNELKAGRPAAYDADQLSQPFYNFLARTKNTKANFSAISNGALLLIDKDLRLTSVYRPEPGFLPLPLQSGINEFTRRQGQFFVGVKDWFGATFAGIERWRANNDREEKMSMSEKIVRVISQRKPSPGNAAYTNILMTKGYIGESFLVGREAEKAHLTKLIENWQLGFRGAVMLTGRRLSGKTLFGELVANRLFSGTVIRLQPNAIINIGGRRMTTTGNLSEALDFIEKYTLQLKPMVWIDDLETWWDKSTSLAENVRELADHIDDYSGRIFYLVATTNAVYHHLDRFMDMERFFQAEVNLDDFPIEDMQRAIRIRHGATHKALVNADGDPFSETAFSRRVSNLHRAAGGNVGDTLNYWAWLTEYCDENRVTPSGQRRYKMPVFVSADTGILLTTIFLERRTNEYHLRKLLGPAFELRYRSILRRLLRVGLLTRHNDGWLEICESVVNDVGSALENNGYLNIQD
ncbi:ATP-binding protein [Neolewinella persica]|uniref:ATP-binding protein n=1 Tax=Neolewinella persica TaxID=70998 RepID=UPI0003665113|nr:ATP-binding protein [Neolewinella persica]